MKPNYSGIMGSNFFVNAGESAVFVNAAPSPSNKFSLKIFNTIHLNVKCLSLTAAAADALYNTTSDAGASFKREAIENTS